MSSTKEAIPTVDQFKFHHDLEVRFRDLDAMGHVNNAVYFTYFEVARTYYLRDIGIKADAEDFSALYPFIMLDAHCRFLAPAVLAQRLTLHMRTARFGTKSFELEYLITDKDSGEPVAAGRSAQVCYDYRAKRTQAVPADFRKKVESFEGRAL